MSHLAPPGRGNPDSSLSLSAAVRRFERPIRRIGNAAERSATAVGTARLPSERFIELNRMTLLLLLCLCGILLSCIGAVADETVTLHGYGRVTASFAPGRAVFTCESPMKADILQGKLLADLLWGAPEGQRNGEAVSSGGVTVVAHSVSGHGAIVVGRVGATVVAIGGDDASGAARAAAADPVCGDPKCRFAPDNSYPVYLDSFDQRAVKFYTHAMQSAVKEGLESHWPFIKELGLGGISYNLGGGMLVGKSPAPGVFNSVDTDYEVREAEINGGLIFPTLSVGGGLPLWAINMFPDSVIQRSSNSTFENEQEARLRESLTAPLSDREAIGLWTLRDTMARYLHSPAIGGWQIYDGPAGIEALDAYEKTTDFSPSGLAGYREWLRDTRGYTLRDVGLRYFNDPGHYKSWGDVKPLDYNAFYGRFDSTSLPIDKLRWTVASAAEPSPDTGPDWRSITFPGSDDMAKVPETDVYYSAHFDASGWLARNSQHDFYLVCGRALPYQKAVVRVWLNGEELTASSGLDTTIKMASAVAMVRGRIRSGENVLVMRVPKGKLVSPTFLTTSRPEEYPSTDRFMNARLVDLVDWQCDSLVKRHRDAFDLARSIDPDRPFTLAAGGGWELAPGLVDLAKADFSTVQNTGREAFYQPWWARLGRIAGFYGTSEPSGNTSAPYLSRMFGQMMIDGDVGHILFWDIESYIKLERETHWFTDHSRLLALFGKALPEAPQIAVFRSSQTMRYAVNHYDGSPWTWDLGRGELNAAHYNWGYATEREVASGLPKTCKVLFDSGSEIMDESTVRAITAFVNNGGTFVALHNTGRHTPLDANSWPVRALTGCNVTATGIGGSVRFTPGDGLFDGWDGRTFAVDTAGRGESIRLSPISPDVTVLASWADGGAAVTSRRIGKGRVICLGSTFWRNGRDVNGVWSSQGGEYAFLERLLTDLGVTRNSDATSHDVWVGNFTCKNGLDDWTIAFNTAQKSTVSDIRFRAETRPAEVTDLTADVTVPFDYADGWVTLKGIEFPSFETRIFAVKRADIADGIPFWWAEKTTYWKASPVTFAPAPPSIPAEPETQQLSTFKFLADRDAAASATPGWTSPEFDDRSWREMPVGPWNLAAPDLKDFAGIGLYRTAFTLPANWSGRSISLNLFSAIAPPVFGDAQFWLNGQPLPATAFRGSLKAVDGKAPVGASIDGLLVPGRNILAIKITGGASWGGEIFSGFGGVIYLAAQRHLTPAIDLEPAFAAVQEDGTIARGDANGASVTGRNLAADVDIPAGWTGRNIWLRIETGTGWIKGIFVNGKLLIAPLTASLGTSFEWNVTNYVSPDQKTHIELWGSPLPLFDRYDPATAPQVCAMDLKEAQIGCLDRR